ncbi:MAG: hypothetical protein J6J13_04600 [Clostridia bacterium]|nr:hypothetical protein [Clostridia bacterium]
MKNTILKLLCLVLSAMMVFAVAGCGDDADKSKDSDNSKTETNASAVVPLGSGEVEYFYDAPEGNADEIIIIDHDEDVIKSISYSKVNTTEGITEAMGQAMLEAFNNKYAELSSEEFIDYDAAYVADEGKVYFEIKANDLDNAETLELVCAMQIIPGLDVEDTYTSYVEYVKKVGYDKK